MSESNVNEGVPARAVRPARGRVSLFDLRWILATLFLIYGIVVTLMGLLSTHRTVTASGQDININVNLWTGIPMLVLGILFALWAGLRPVVPPQPADPSSVGPGSVGPGSVSPEASGDGTAARG